VPLPVLYGSVGVLAQAAFRAGRPVPGALALFDARIADSVVLTEGNVTGWLDLSGSGRHATTSGTHTVFPTYDGTKLAWNAAAGAMGMRFNAPGAAQMTIVVTATRLTQTNTSSSAARPVVCAPSTASGTLVVGTRREGATSPESLSAEAWGGGSQLATWTNNTRVCWVVLTNGNAVRIVGSNGQDVSGTVEGLNGTNMAAVTQFLIGYDPGSAARVFTGYIERLALYSGNLTADQITRALAWGVAA